MNRQLLIMRHAKSDWDQPVNDFDRPLNKRGRKSIVLVGEYLQNQEVCPDLIYSSTARRAAQTIKSMCSYINIDEQAIIWRPDLYLASLEQICKVLAETPVMYRQVMLVGHNPGLESLVQYLASNEQLSDDLKSFPTAAIARFELPEDWSRLYAGCARLISITKPRDLSA